MTRTPLARTTVRDALDSAVIALTAAGCDTPRLDAELLLADAMGVDRAVIVADRGRPIDPPAARRFQEHARRRTRREPVAYILGRKGFRHLDLHVDARVLVPRPETEHLVEAALTLPRNASVVDVGTGSGAVALALKDERPDLHVIGTDASAPALEVARANAHRLDLDVELLHGDLLDPLTRPVDAVVSNPPYVAHGDPLAPDIAHHEPHEALFGGADGLEITRRLVPQAVDAQARFIALEVGMGQAPAIEALLREHGYGVTEIVPDLAGIERIVVGRR